MVQCIAACEGVSVAVTGKLKPYMPALTIRDYNLYLRYLRGVRYELYKEYGLAACITLAHHGVIFAILADSLAGRTATCQIKHIPGKLRRQPIMCQTKGIRLAAQIEVLMGWHALQDCNPKDLPFKKRDLRRVERVLLHSAYEKAVKEEPALERLFCQQQAQQHAHDELQGQSYAMAAEPMSNVYGALFALLAPDDSTQCKNMRYIGTCIGRAFYLLDKADSRDEDEACKRYNVFVVNGLSRDAAQENAHRQALSAANDLARVYAMLDVKLNRSLLDNIMILGMRSAVDPLEYEDELLWETPSE